jgi:metallo-beta-lactamase class B
MKILFAILCLVLLSMMGMSKPDTLHLHKDLMIVKLNKRTYIHISFIPVNGKQIPCNGLVYVNQGEAIVLDTPTTDSMAIYLIEWIEQDLHAKIKAMVANHFHEDCLGGMLIFMDYGTATIAQRQTCKLAGDHGFRCPQRYFKDTLSLSVGNRIMECWYPGSAHTIDNTVAYLPAEKILFGGCMVRALNWDLGNTRDANLNTWPTTIEKVKTKYPKVKRVIPGHGAPGGTDLFDHTLSLLEVP